MSASVPSLPLPGSLPVSARVAPARRSIATWAPPRATDVVLDPVAPPVGQPVRQAVVSPWPAPDPAMRIASMPPPRALQPQLDASRGLLTAPPTTPMVAATLVVADTAGSSAPLVTLDAPVPESLPKVGHIDPVRPDHERHEVDAPRSSAKRIALIAALAGAATAAVAVVANVL